MLPDKTNVPVELVTVPAPVAIIPEIVVVPAPLFAKLKAPVIPPDTVTFPAFTIVELPVNTISSSIVPAVEVFVLVNVLELKTVSLAISDFIL